MDVILYVVMLAIAFVAGSVLCYNLLPAPVSVLARRSVDARPVDVSRLPSLVFRLFFPLLNRLAPICHRIIGWRSYRASTPQALERAGLGDAITVDHLLAMKAIMAVLIPIVVAQFVALVTNPAIFLLVGVGGFFLPDRLVADLRRARETEVVQDLPGAVDVLALSVEAGLDFLAAIQRFVERGAPGVLRDELATILNDIRLGKSRAEALKAFGTRIAVPEVSSFVSVLVQADLLGSSIGVVLQSQAERMRVERFQRAESAGARASQKILFPLVLFIFPAVLIVILGPVILQFIYGT